jgi:hypothetical protein
MLTVRRTAEDLTDLVVMIPALLRHLLPSRSEPRASLI